MKRFYVFDTIGEPPRELTKIVKCVKYYSCWEFDSIESYTAGNTWFFAAFGNPLRKLLVMPFDINRGQAIARAESF